MRVTIITEDVSQQFHSSLSLFQSAWLSVCRPPQLLLHLTGKLSSEIHEQTEGEKLQSNLQISN